MCYCLVGVSFKLLVSMITQDQLGNNFALQAKEIDSLNQICGTVDSVHSTSLIHGVNLQVYMEKLAKVAHENWLTDVHEYDGEALIRANPSLRAVSMQTVESSTRVQSSGGPDVHVRDTRSTQTYQQQLALPSSHPALSTYHLSSKFPEGSAGHGIFCKFLSLKCAQHGKQFIYSSTVIISLF